MRVLLDECVPKGLIKELREHQVRTVAEMGRAGVKNGELLQRAGKEFDIFVTVDRSLEYQQNLSRFALCVVLIHTPSNDIVVLRPLMPAVRDALQRAKPGLLIHVAA